MGLCSLATDNNAQVELDWHQGFEQCHADMYISLSGSVCARLSVCVCIYRCVCMCTGLYEGHAWHPSLSCAAEVQMSCLHCRQIPASNFRYTCTGIHTCLQLMRAYKHTISDSFQDKIFFTVTFFISYLNKSIKFSRVGCDHSVY